MDYLYILLSKLFCLGCAFAIFYLLHLIDENAIMELGYGQASRRRMRKLIKTLPRWDRVLHWTLVRMAKQRKKKEVWFYFGLHIFACLGLTASIILFLIPFQISEWRVGVSRELYCPLVTFIVHTGIRLVIDLLIRPSEQRRYGISNKKGKK